MLRTTRLGAGLLALASLAAGCSVGADASGGDKPFAGQSLEIVASLNESEQANFQGVLDAFKARTGATVKYTDAGTTLAQVLDQKLAANQAPNVALVPQPGLIAELARKGQIKRIEGAALEAVRANYNPAWQRLGQVNGVQYGFYFKSANKSSVWIRSDSLAKAGGAAPRTWEDFMKFSRRVADSGTPAMAVCGADGWTLTDWFENVYLRLAGPDKYDKLFSHQLRWDDKSVVDTLVLLSEYWSAKGFVYRGPDAVQETFDNCVPDVFGKEPKAGMLMEGDFVAALIASKGAVKVGVGATFFEFPAVNGSRRSIVTGGDQVVAFKDDPLTTEFLAFMASPDAPKIMAAKGGFISANENMDPSVYPDDTTRQLAKAVVTAEVLRFDGSDLTPAAFGGTKTSSMWVILQEFLRNPTDPTATAKKLEAAAVKDFPKKS